MNILVLGRGPIGAEYGWALEKAGHNVEFLVRPGRLAEYGDYIDLEIMDARVESNGVQVNGRWPIVLREEIPNNISYDLIIVSVNHDAVQGAVDTIKPIVGNATVLMFSNIWDELKNVAAPLPSQQVIWGFPGGAGGFIGNTLVSGFLKSITLETADSAVSKERHQEVVSIFEGAGFAMDYQSNMQAWYWDHIILNGGMSAMILKEGSYSKVLQSLPALTEMVALIKEMLPLIPAKGEEYPQNSMMHLQAPDDAVAQHYYQSFLGMDFSLRLMEKVENTGYLTEKMRATYPRDIYMEANRFGIELPKLELLKSYFILDEVGK